MLLQDHVSVREPAGQTPARAGRYDGGSTSAGSEAHVTSLWQDHHWHGQHARASDHATGRIHSSRHSEVRRFCDLAALNLHVSLEESLSKVTGGVESTGKARQPVVEQL